MTSGLRLEVGMRSLYELRRIVRWQYGADPWQNRFGLANSVACITDGPMLYKASNVQNALCNRMATLTRANII